MCRLYGFRASEQTRVECSLVQAQNALLKQSDRDRRGVRNGDGWGLAHYVGGKPRLQKRARAAFDDLLFPELAADIASSTFVGHVRAATVGSIAPENVHPFRHGPWVFAHNGTVPAFQEIYKRLALDDFAPPGGSTDSEHVFHWMLSRMPEFGLSPERASLSVEPICDLIASSVDEIVRLAAEERTPSPAKLNFMLTDGQNLVVSRWGNSLHWVERAGLRDCEVCGLRHSHPADGSYRAVAVASEPITKEDWQEVPEASILAIDAELNGSVRDLMVRQAALG